jgi:hypothetical protein
MTITEPDPAPRSKRRAQKGVVKPTNVLDGYAPIEAFAAERGRHKKTVRNWLLRAGIELRRIGQDEYAKIADVRHLIETGRAPERRGARR